MGSVSLGGEEPAPLEPGAEQPQFSKMLAPLTASLGGTGGISFVQEIIDLSGGLIRTKGQALALLIGFIALSLGLTYFIGSSSLAAPAHPPPGMAGNAPNDPIYRKNPPIPGSHYQSPTVPAAQ